MPANLRRRLAIFSCSFLLAGCAVRSVYIPVSQDVPLFDSVRTATGALYLSGNHIELQAAVNPTRRLAIATNINFGTGITVYDAALGTYGRKGNRWRYEGFAGFGYTANVIYPGTNDALFRKKGVDYEIRSLYQRGYLQGALGYFGTIDAYRLRYFFALSARASVLHFNEFTYREIDKSKTVNPLTPVYLVDRSYADTYLWLLEPCLTNKVHLGNLYGLLQLQAIIPYTGQMDLRYTHFSPGVLFSAGIGFTVPLKAKPRTWEE